MRILTTALLAGAVILAVNSKTTPVGTEKQIAEGVQVPADADVDNIVTGNTLSRENIETWEAERKKYLECPSCAASQPFPGD